MARPEPVDDGLWELVRPLLADRTPQRTGRPRVSDRRAMAPWRQTEHRSPQNQARLGARAMALDDRAYLRVTAQLPSPAHPLGTRSSRAYGLPHPRACALICRRYLRRLIHNDASKKSSFTENFGSAAKCLRSPSCYFNSGYFNSAPMELAPKLK